MSQVRIYSRFDVPSDPGFTSVNPTMTQQHFANEVDINQIMARYKQTGLLPQIDGYEYGDFTNADYDYQTAMNFILQAQDAFESMPAQLRKRFNNDPAELLSFLSDQANLDEAVSLGLVQSRKSTTEKTDVEVVDPTVTQAPES